MSALKTILLSLAVTISLFAGEGKIVGKVTDAETGEPLIGANVIIDNTKLGAATSIDGTYIILDVPEGTYTIIGKYIGYKETKVKEVIVSSNLTTEVNIKLIAEAYQIDCIEIVSEKPLINKNLTNSTTVVSPDNTSVRGVNGVVSTQSGVVNQNGNLHVRGSRSDNSGYIVNGVQEIQFQAGGYTWGNFNTEEYNTIVENEFLESMSNPLSTFSIDVDAASYSNVRRFINANTIPPRDAVRVEEFINYFDYDYPQPKDGSPFSITTEIGECPWNKDNYLIHIGIKGKELSDNEKRQSNLVFLLDVSGSMTPENKLPLVKRSMKMMLDKISPNDKVSIVVYAGAAGLVLPSTYVSEKQKILDAIDRLNAGGSTAGGAGILLAYKTAEENFIKGGNNRIILATDGDFNVGVSNTSDLVKLVEEKKKSGIYLTILGFGMDNLKDGRLEELADKGNGNYYYIDNFMEAKKVLGHEITSTLFTIAKDVKIQVEFNPAKVLSYRLIGYENRMLKKEDFEDDKKDAGELGAGHTVTALYEVVPVKEVAAIQGYENLRYQEHRLKYEAVSSKEVLLFSIRYKEPDEDTSKLLTKTLELDPENEMQVSENFLFSSAVAQFALLLRDSQFKGTSNFESVISLAEDSQGKDEFGYREEFITLVRNTKDMIERISIRQ
ncbi:MAG: von Willebrand factor type A domain-containing protein [Ignavibacteriales bacterium]|nr:MAG: von Willebrand factor type A domain-containing protein [Ignavibacteriales bacterium]